MSLPSYGVRHTVTCMSADDWHQVLTEFQDSSVFQSLPFCLTDNRATRWEHLLVRRGAELIAAAQVRLMSVPWTRSAVAYVFRGPMCHRVDREYDVTCRNLALEALRREYLGRRRCQLRVALPMSLAPTSQVLSHLMNAGFTPARYRDPERTIILDLSRSLSELRQGLEKKWRNCLSSAERHGLDVHEGCDDTLFDQFLGPYREMLARKQIAEPGDIRRFRAIQAALPESLKMRVFLVSDRGIPVAGAICSAIGRQGVFLFGATSDQGMQNKASYLAQWRVIEWLKLKGCAEYDLHGANAKSNPGVFAFKKGLCGRNGREVDSAGYFDAYNGLPGRVLLTLADLGDRGHKAVRRYYRRQRGFRG